VLHVESYISRDAVHAGETFAVALRALINPGWHIYAPDLEDEFLIPTAVSLSQLEGFAVQEYSYPTSLRRRFKYSEAELSIYEGEAFFGALVTADKTLTDGGYELTGTFQFQACDAMTCLPPKEVTFKIAIKIVDGGQETKPENQAIFSKIKFKARPENR
jgi:DsbC/DsbD-like thiol-disulfide interchange protein